MAEAPEYKLFTTTRYDEGLEKLPWNHNDGKPSPFLLLPFHFQRLINATQAHGWTEAQKALRDYEHFKSICLKAVEEVKASNNTDPKALRLRVTLDHHGVLQTTCAPVPPFANDPSLLARGAPPTAPQDVIEVRLDPSPTTPSLFTSTKTTYRPHYEEARVRSNIPPLTSPQGPYFEALLIDNDNHIIESDIYNVAFYRSGRWVTPNAKYGCLPGVFRRWLIGQGLVDEDQDSVLVKEAVKNGEYVLLSNGAQGCRLGKISL